MQLKINFLCRDSILAAPIVLDSALFLDLAKRAGMSGIQEWLSFYYKSPMHAPEVYPEHDLFIQLMKLKNTLRTCRAKSSSRISVAEYHDWRRSLSRATDAGCSSAAYSSASCRPCPSSTSPTCCCLWIVGWRHPGRLLEQQNDSRPITAGRGALTGVLAGIVGGVRVADRLGRCSTSSWPPFSSGSSGDLARNSRDMPPEVRRMLEMFAAESGARRYVFGFVSSCSRARFSHTWRRAGRHVLPQRRAARSRGAA